MRRLLAVAAVAVLAAMAAPAGPVSAHAELLGTEPPDGAVVATTPDVAVLEFNEPVSLAGGSVRVIGRDGNDVGGEVEQLGARVTIDLPDELPEGTYTLAYQVISVDSHRISGATTFSIGFADATAPIVTDVEEVGSVLRVGRSLLLALAYLGVLLAVGLWWAFAHVFTSRPNVDVARDAILGASAVGLAALAVGLPVRIAVLGGDAALQEWSTFRALLNGPVGHASAVSLVGIIAFVVGAMRDWRPWTVSLAGLVAVLGFTIEGHSRAESPVVLAMVSDGVHLAAGAMWLGGVAGLAIVWRRSVTSDLAGMVRRFSTVAAVCLGAVAVSGLILGLMIVPELSALWNTGYGVTLLVKVGLVAVVVGLGAVNRYVVLPRLRDDAPAPEGRRRELVGVISAETVLMTAVIVVAAFLVDQSPVRAASASPSGPVATNEVSSTTTTWPEPTLGEVTTLELSGGAGIVTFSGLPTQTGGASIVISLADADGGLLETAEPPTLSVRSESLDIGPLAWDVHELGGGSYHVSATLPAPGTWDLTVRVRIDDFTSATADTELTIEG